MNAAAGIVAVVEQPITRFSFGREGRQDCNWERPSAPKDQNVRHSHWSSTTFTTFAHLHQLSSALLYLPAFSDTHKGLRRTSAEQACTKQLNNKAPSDLKAASAH
eukprot:2902316-Pleurochrysis_carterae.AAC.1